MTDYELVGTVRTLEMLTDPRSGATTDNQNSANVPPATMTVAGANGRTISVGKDVRNVWLECKPVGDGARQNDVARSAVVVHPEDVQITIGGNTWLPVLAQVFMAGKVLKFKISVASLSGPQPLTADLVSFEFLTEPLSS